MKNKESKRRKTSITMKTVRNTKNFCARLERKDRTKDTIEDPKFRVTVKHMSVKVVNTARWLQK